MMRELALNTRWLIFSLTLILAIPVLAAQPHEADLRAIQNFKLTPAFFTNYQAYEREVVQNPCALDPMLALQQAGEQSSLEQTAASFDAQPGVHAALQRHNLTAREVLLGMAVWVGAAAQDLAAQNPDMVKRGEIQLNPDFKISPESLAFYRQHKEEFRQHQMQLSKEQMQRNGGKLPDCGK
jgi:hypothetical protein